MKLYKNDCVSFDSFVQTIEKIETFLLEAVVHETRMDTDTFSIIKQFLTLSRLMSENEKWMNGQVSYIERFRSEEHTSELQSRFDLVCRLLLEKKKQRNRKKSTSR